MHDVDVFACEAGAVVSLHVKFDRDVTLADAHRVADGIEAGLLELPGVSDARTHLEPIEPDLRPAEDSRTVYGREQEIRELVRATTGYEARDMRALRTRSGLVVLLTVAVGADLTLREAHKIAGRLERVIRRDNPEIIEVVVHTEPNEAAAAQ